MVALIDNSEDHNQSVKKSKKTLDLFWKLGHSKNEKQIIEWSSKILQSVSKSEVETSFVLRKLLQSLAGPEMSSKTAYFVCLAELFRQSGTQYASVSEEVRKHLKPSGTVSKGEEANFLMAQLMVYSAVLRSGMDLSGEEKTEIIEHLGEIASSRNYMHLPVIKLCVEHFVSDRDLLQPLKERFPLKMDADLNMDSMYLVLSFHKEDAPQDYLKEIGASKLTGTKSLNCYSSCVLNATLPPNVLADHPGFKLLLTTLVEKKAVKNFWQLFSSNMTTSNNKGLVGWIILKELSKINVELIPELLTTHTLTIGTKLAVKQASVGVVKEVFEKLSASASVDKLDLVTRLLEVDLCWDKLPLGGTVFSLLASASPETVKAAAETFVKTMLGDGRIFERAHSAGTLTRLVGLPRMQGELAWRQEILHHLASVSLLAGVKGVAALNSGGRDQMKDVLYRGLDSRNKSLSDSITLLVSVVNFIEEQRGEGATSTKQLSDDHLEVANKALGRIRKLDKTFKSTSNNEAGVFLYLFCHMWLQMFLQPELGADVLGELEAVCDRWEAVEGGGGGEEPAWIEVVTEILLSLLAQNNHLLRAVVSSVFSVLGRDMTGPAMESLLKVIQKKDEGEAGQDEDEDEDDEDMDTEDADKESDEDENEDSDESDDEDDDENEDEENNEVDESMKNKISLALGNHADGEESESDLEMDDIPDEELNRLDQKLVDAFKALGGRKDKHAKKKAELVKVANMHFKLRALELVDIYLAHSPNPELVPSLVTALVSALDGSIRAGAAREPLTKRLKASLGRVAGLRFKAEDHGAVLTAGTRARVVATLAGLLGLSTSGSGVITGLGPAYPRLTTALLRLAHLCDPDPATPGDLQQVYEASLESWLVMPTCVLPAAVFSLALGHSWPGCWSLASRLAEAAFSAKVRQYRRVAALSVLSGLLANKGFVKNNQEALGQLVAELLPNITKEIGKIEAVEKVKPKYLEELFSILSNATNLETVALEKTFSEKLVIIAKAWPSNKIYKRSKGQLMKLLKGLNIKIEFSTTSMTTNGSNGHTDHKNQNGDERSNEDTTVQKKKKKKKQKSQERLKEAKEMKIKMAQAQEVAEIPSFSSLVPDNINNSEESDNNSIKRKVDKLESTDTDQSNKKKKKKKLKD